MSRYLPTGSTLVHLPHHEQGATAHRIGAPSSPVTTCGQNATTGSLLPASQAKTDWAAVWCLACWPPEPTQGSVWRHRHDPARRAQVTQVTQTEVETRIVFGPGSFDQSATVARFSRRTWHTWWTPEGAADGGEG